MSELTSSYSVQGDIRGIQFVVICAYSIQILAWGFTVLYPLGHSTIRQLTPVAVALLFWIMATSSGMTMIEGGEGNKPIQDPGWPKGAAAVFNSTSRIAFWVGPPFGGGQWHAECKGDAKVINEALAAFAKLDVPVKRLTIVDGIGYSFWLDPNGTKRGDRATKIDWSFTVWEPERWKFQNTLPPGISALAGSKDTGPAAEFQVYVAGVKLSEIVIPEGLEVNDQRLEAHGFKLSDGRVVEGVVTDADSKLPIEATIRIEEIVPKDKGGYDYPKLSESKSDAQGHWVVKNFSEKWCRVIIEAKGYAPRVVQHTRYDRQPGWVRIDTEIGKSGSLSGIVFDDLGHPLPEADIQMRDVTLVSGARYDLPTDGRVKTDSQGRFQFTGLPVGKCNVQAYHENFFRAGLGLKVEIPKADIELRMAKSSSLDVQVTFGDGRPEGYIVNVEPVGGSKVGSWGGSSNLSADSSVHFKQIPPGKYHVFGRPNPGSDSEQTEKVEVELQGGSASKVELKAK